MTSFNPKARFHTFTMIPDDVMRCVGLSYGERCAYARLIRYFDEESMCACVRNSVFAAALGCSERTIQRFTKKLREVGLITIEGEESSQGLNKYYFLPPEAALRALEAKETSQDDEFVGEDLPELLEAVMEEEGGTTTLSSPHDRSVVPPRQPCRPHLIDTQLETHTKREDLSSSKIRGGGAPEPKVFAPEGAEDGFAAQGAFRGAALQKARTPKRTHQTQEPPPTTTNPPPQGRKRGKALEEAKKKVREAEAVAMKRANRAKEVKERRRSQEMKKLMNKKLSELVPEDLKKALVKEELLNGGLARSELESLWKRRLLNRFRECRAEVGQLRAVIRELQTTWFFELDSEGIGVVNGEQIIPKWAGKEFGQLFELLDRYSGKSLEIGLKYLVRQWLEISGRYLKGQGESPTLGLLLRLHDSLMPEAHKREAYMEALEEYDRWKKDNPTEIRPPGDLGKKYFEAKEKLSGLGR